MKIFRAVVDFFTEQPLVGPVANESRMRRLGRDAGAV